MLKTHRRSEPFQVRGEIAAHGNAKPCKASVDARIRPMFALRPTATVAVRVHLWIDTLEITFEGKSWDLS